MSIKRLTIEVDIPVSEDWEDEVRIFNAGDWVEFMNYIIEDDPIHKLNPESITVVAVKDIPGEER